MQGDSLIDGIPETLAKLRAAGKKMFFVTNNSTKSRKGYKKKFDSLGLDIPAEEIFSSSFAAAGSYYIRRSPDETPLLLLFFVSWQKVLGGDNFLLILSFSPRILDLLSLSRAEN